LEISVIKQYPKDRRPVKTLLTDRSQKRRVLSTLKQRMSAKEQAIVICPVIQSSEDTDLKNVLDMYRALKGLFAPRYHVGLIHGRLPPEEKTRIMDEFREGQIDLLVGTTVIEVGIHAPGATVMVVEHPERFGITQLHQLRGRVGRGEKRGLCLLMMPEGLSDETHSRLKVMTECNDGFEIARKDLELRGQGELTGIRQAGAGDLDFMEVFREPELLLSAKREAEHILASDPTLSHYKNRIMREMIKPSFAILTDF
jgi:ATP-dependent DNA helicase RecG